MNISEWKKSVLTSGKRLAVPLMTHPGIELNGNSIFEAVNVGEVHYNAIKAIHDNFETAVSVANIMMDLTVEAEAFGSKITFPSDESPSVTDIIVHDENTINLLRIPALSDGRIPEYLKATELAAKNITDKPVFAGCIGPFSLAGRLYGMSEIMTALYFEPDSIKALLKKCSEFLLAYVSEFKRLGADGIIMAEPAAGLLSAEMCDEFSSDFVREIVKQVQDERFLFVLHNCGNTGHATQSMISTGAGALHLGNKIDMVKALEETPGNILVMGNLDPVGVFKMSAPDEVYNVTMDLLRKTTGYKNFIISSGCDTPPGVPVDNIKAFFKAVKDYNS